MDINKHCIRKSNIVKNKHCNIIQDKNDPDDIGFEYKKVLKIRFILDDKPFIFICLSVIFGLLFFIYKVLSFK